ncbi:SDR family NAD(P)-dependent oxidoreductase [Pseudoalteromonas peptidolytica]|uniref:SDR family NAD(P)-dependent oxidoreductase n=1 Tax=Pseudoalteromonas peptidolytica TaxID=61150 RepID=UPI00298EA888|nr:SDR family NAD(P)-dependent oxidoreductase [Pseudoalteromonas peptidolytica]MDW7549445.1 SDR family NAD(P)-dependent oxidoreductase [Pseudoalteromonas peptidolytica]
MLLKGKVALITGAGRGIGLTTAKRFCEEGATVYVNGRSAEQINKIVLDLQAEGFDARGLVFDVANADEVKDAFRLLIKQTKTLDILVNNAGILDDALIGMVTVEQIKRTFEINTFSTLYTSQYAARLMGRNKSGSIINISSIIGTNGNTGQAVYGGSKAAVIGITKSLAKELALSNIRVNAVAPGFIKTDMAFSIPEDKFKERMDSIAMARIGEPADIANTAVYLASDLSSYVTGQIIGVDGGMLI